VELTINITDLFDPEGGPIGEQRADLRHAIVTAAASRLLANMTDDERRDLRAKATEKYERLMDERIAAQVDELMTEPFQRHKPWGDKIGEPVTVRELLREQMEKWLKAPASRDNFGSDNNGAKSLADLMQATTRQVMTQDMKAAVAEARKAVSDQIRTKALAAAVAALAP
jgi:hypothetical protein